MWINCESLGPLRHYRLHTGIGNFHKANRGPLRVRSRLFIRKTERGNLWTYISSISPKTTAANLARPSSPSVLWYTARAQTPRHCGAMYSQPDDGILGNNPYGMRWIQPTPNEQAVCVRAFIGLAVAGDVAACQTLPWTYCGWHSGRSNTSNLERIGGTGTGTKDENGRPADLYLSNDMGRRWSYWTAPRLSRPGNLARTHTAPARKIPAGSFPGSYNSNIMFV